MKLLRTALFWIHLACGVASGLVIFDMSLTGALLAFKPQILNILERDVRRVDPLPGQPRMAMSAVLARLGEQRPESRPTSVTIDANPSVSVAIALDRDATVYVDPYSGRLLGAGSARAQAFFRTVENWHRWLAASGEGRAPARALTDASNAAFLVLAVTGLFLWWPRKWLPQHLKAIVWFRRTTTGRARDFNWHNVIGFWCAPVLIVLTSTGVIMSYTWASNLLYRFSGSPVPAAQRGAGGRGGAPREGSFGAQGRDGYRAALPGSGRGRASQADERRPPRTPEGSRAAAGDGRERGELGDRADGRPSISGDLDALWARAEQQVPEWRAITMRWPARSNAPVSFSVTEPSWNAFARSQLSLSATTGEIVSWEPYRASSPGQKMRQWARFAHTGELGRWPGQTLAAVACVGGVVLVMTGFALAWRRLLGWSVWAQVRKNRLEGNTREAPVAPPLLD